MLSAAAPFSGIIFLDPYIILSSDPRTFLKLEEACRGDRLMLDRRINDWITVNAFLFNASFRNGTDIELQVNPEFENAVNARVEALKFAPVSGQLPSILRKGLKTVWLHKELNPFGGGNNNLLIHTGQPNDYISNGILEETLVHEASHTSLDADHGTRQVGWLHSVLKTSLFPLMSATMGTGRTSLKLSLFG